MFPRTGIFKSALDKTQLVLERLDEFLKRTITFLDRIFQMLYEMQIRHVFRNGMVNRPDYDMFRVEEDRKIIIK